MRDVHVVITGPDKRTLNSNSYHHNTVVRLGLYLYRMFTIIHHVKKKFKINTWL